MWILVSLSSYRHCWIVLRVHLPGLSIHKRLLCMCDQHVAGASHCKIVSMYAATRLATFSACLPASREVASEAAAAT